MSVASAGQDCLMNGHWWSIVAAWAVAVVAVVAIEAAFAPGRVLPLLPLVLAGTVVVAFGLQLAVADRLGFVRRLTASALGAFGVVLIGSAIAAAR